MKRQVRQPVDPSHDPDLQKKRQLLCEAVQQEWQVIQGTIQVYVSRAIKQFGSNFSNTCVQDSIEVVAKEILHETVETALKKAGEFDLNLLPSPWLLGIAAKKIQQWQRQKIQENRWITPVAELPQVRKIKQQLNYETLSDEEILGLLHQSSNSSDPDSQLMLEYLLSLVKDSDREVLKLAFVDGKTGESLAAALGTTIGAAYTKKHRVIARLRQAYAQSNLSLEEGR
ncbi:RNA polymerase sigma factor [Fischerella sp. PCC 9605]|uniref:RNA polymerase sigma factor n=1 Tax=Fischerella sp. PCC 9605 TaxID=1173024 RepID=UPI00047E51B5|nr:sigma-70 family RNA polymerase sigma factor [Fischerella sp. PCC 9605]